MSLEKKRCTGIKETLKIIVLSKINLLVFWSYECFIVIVVRHSGTTCMMCYYDFRKQLLAKHIRIDHLGRSNVTEATEKFMKNQVFCLQSIIGDPGADPVGGDSC